MNTLEVKFLVAILFSLGLYLGYQSWHHHVYQQGYAIAENLYKGKMRAADDAAKAKAVLLNQQIALAQKGIDDTRKVLTESEKELNDAKVHQRDLEYKLRTGVARMSVLVSANQACAGRSPVGGAGAPGMDNEAEVRADLDPRSAEAITRATDTGDNAIRRLNGCIAAYDSVKAAADRLAVSK